MAKFLNSIGSETATRHSGTAARRNWHGEHGDTGTATLARLLDRSTVTLFVKGSV